MPEITLPSYAYTPQLGWSTTRSDTFRSCRRRYFFQYYAKYDREIPLERIQLLRGLSSIPMTVGTAVHEVLAVLLRRLLRSGEPIDGERFWRHVDRTVRELLSFTSLMEVHYGQRPAPQPEELLEPVRACLENVLTSGRYAWLREHLPADPAYLIEPPGYGEARLKGLKIYAKVDVLFQVGGDTLILDWKTGRQDPAKHGRQLLGYAAWAEHNLQIPAEQIRCLVAYLLPNYSEIEKQPSRGDLEALAGDVAAEIEQMQDLCQFPERNIPLAKEAFPLTVHRSTCRHCQFRELCGRGEQPAGDRLWPEAGAASPDPLPV